MHHEEDPFRLYQSYIEICKPLDYETTLHNLEEENEKLKHMLEVEKTRADTIQAACERYLKEEAELKRKFFDVKTQLDAEKKSHEEDVQNLTYEIGKWSEKYRVETRAM